MDSPADLSSAAHSSVPTSPPRVWTVLVAFALLVTAILVGGVISASTAMAMEMLRSGVSPQDTGAIQALTEKLKAMPWLMVAAVMTSSCLGLVAALMGGFLSPTPMMQRLCLGAGAPPEPVPTGP
ncbi:hypothetical protein D7V80_35940 [Corallococcus sp. CA054B]|uniref:hypothetical protein n=1 Tax=Corallococcus sp. CA054B TaxID=2316734 RepID=UPI000EA2A8F4|nr:hypothetical protein [Corallococcus sp. CA054B]RKG60208.1 hypothetical protein D7V80_35940 [Corallococcus sp. CA054B]